MALPASRQATCAQPGGACSSGPVIDTACGAPGVLPGYSSGTYPDFVNNRSRGVLGVLLREYREFLEGALWLFLALSGLLGLRLGL